MNEFPELKPGMLVECKNEIGIYEYYLVVDKIAGSDYEVYRLNITSGGDVSLSLVRRVRDFPERAAAVYASIVGSPALSPTTIARIAGNGEDEIQRTLVWQREQKPLEVTMDEVCAKFGQEVKIVKAHA